VGVDKTSGRKSICLFFFFRTDLHNLCATGMIPKEFTMSLCRASVFSLQKIK